MTAPIDEGLSISGFELLTKLSSGGMGDVLLARRRGVHGFEKLLAIKTIRGELAKRGDIRSMFHDEARLSARLDHPNIAQVYDFGEQNNVLYLAMEYVPGIALNKLLAKRGGPLPPAVAMRIIAEVCRGLHAAHELCELDGTLLGVVHRDVSPGNLILTFDGRMKILDFGIAFMRGRESPDTIVGELKGKPSYMAPEHLRAQGVDRRADIYSASVVLHELLTGRKLFTRETVVATVLAVESQPVPTPSSIAGPLPSGLDEIVMRGLERKPADRFPDARALATALDRLAADLGGDSLEAFVDAELSFERESHRSWMQSVLSGRESSSGSSDPNAPAPMKTPAGARARAVAILDEGTQPIPLKAPSTRESAMPLPQKSVSASQRVHPLVDHVTLVPPVAETSDAVATVGQSGGRSVLPWMLVIVLLAAGGVYGGYRFVQQETVVVVPAKLPPEPIVKQDVVPTATVAPQIVEAKVEEPSEPSEPAEKAHAAKAVPHHPPAKKKPPVKQEPRKPDNNPEKAAVGFGFVTIGAEPYALVRIDGQEVGVTPIMGKKLPAGTHEIQLVRPDTGEIRLKKTVTLADGDRQRITIP